MKQNFESALRLSGANQGILPCLSPSTENFGPLTLADESLRIVRYWLCQCSEANVAIGVTQASRFSAIVPFGEVFTL